MKEKNNMEEIKQELIRIATANNGKMTTEILKNFTQIDKVKKYPGLYLNQFTEGKKICRKEPLFKKIGDTYHLIK